MTPSRPVGQASGTAVLHPDSGHVLGVIRGHILQAGTGNLTMTLVHAIDLLQPDSKARFCEIRHRLTRHVGCRRHTTEAGLSVGRSRYTLAGISNGHRSFH